MPDEWVKAAFALCQDYDTPMAHAFRRAFGIECGSSWTGGFIVPESEYEPDSDVAYCIRQRIGALDRR